MRKICYLFALCFIVVCVAQAQHLTDKEFSDLSNKSGFKPEQISSVCDEDLLKLADMIDYKRWKPIVQIYDELIARHPTDNRYYYYRASAYGMATKMRESQRDAITAYRLYTELDNQELPKPYRFTGDVTEEQYLQGLNMMVDAADKITQAKSQLWQEIGETVKLGISPIADSVSNIVPINNSNNSSSSQSYNQSVHNNAIQSSPNNESRKWSSCLTCKGTGVCRNCGGTGKYSYTKDGKCHECRPVGSGKCGTCKGKKGSYVN